MAEKLELKEQLLLHAQKEPVGVSEQLVQSNGQARADAPAVENAAKVDRDDGDLTIRMGKFQNGNVKFSLEANKEEDKEGEKEITTKLKNIEVCVRVQSYLTLLVFKSENQSVCERVRSNVCVETSK